MSAEKFCLRWNDFEANVSSAFRDLREEKDFFDVTLACEDSQIEAHKVILSACSPFFKNILRRHPHQHPLLYLKGVQMTELANVLNFMYMGEVNVAQEQLNNFLSVSEELQVKGLTQGGQHVQRKPQTVHNDLGISSKPPKKPKPALPSTFPPGASYSTNIADQENDPDIQEVAQVKPEPSQTASESDIHYQNDGAVALEDQYGYDDYEGDPNIVDTNVYDTSIDKGKFIFVLRGVVIDVFPSSSHSPIYLIC